MIWFLFTSQMRKRAISVLPVTSEVAESNLNRYVRDFLQVLVDNSQVVRILDIASCVFNINRKLKETIVSRVH